MASPRAATTLTPVKQKTTHSNAGHTGTAGAGLKSPGRYQCPNRCARIAAFPYQPSSVYFAQSPYQGVWFEKSAVRCSACSSANPAIKAIQTPNTQRCPCFNNGLSPAGAQSFQGNELVCKYSVSANGPSTVLHLFKACPRVSSRQKTGRMQATLFAQPASGEGAWDALLGALRQPPVHAASGSIPKADQPAQPLFVGERLDRVLARCHPGGIERPEQRSHKSDQRSVADPSLGQVEGKCRELHMQQFAHAKRAGDSQQNTRNRQHTGLALNHAHDRQLRRAQRFQNPDFARALQNGGVHRLKNDQKAHNYRDRDDHVHRDTEARKLRRRIKCDEIRHRLNLVVLKSLRVVDLLDHRLFVFWLIDFQINVGRLAL